MTRTLCTVCAYAAAVLLLFLPDLALARSEGEETAKLITYVAHWLEQTAQGEGAKHFSIGFAEAEAHLKKAQEALRAGETQRAEEQAARAWLKGSFYAMKGGEVEEKMPAFMPALVQVLARVAGGMEPIMARQGQELALTTSSTSSSGYRIERGDVLSIKFYYHPDLNERVIVRPDGRISLRLVDEVEAAGLTPPDLDALLTRQYASFLEKPEVTIIVEEFSAQRVYVGGEVQTPQIVPLRGRLTALQALYQAGGILPSANLKDVVLLRYVGGEQAKAIKINLAAVEKGQAPDPELFPYDVIYVPRSAIANINLFVDQYINQIVPRSIAFPFTTILQNPVSRAEAIRLPSP